MRGLIRYLLPGLLLMLAVSCGGDVLVSLPPTATPTPIVFVTPVPTAVPLSARSASDWAIRGLTSVRKFPAELEAESK